DTLMAILPVISKALVGLTVYPDKMEAAIDSTMMATDLADYLVMLGIPFREAHALVAQTVRIAYQKNKSMKELTLTEYRSIHPDFDEMVYHVFDPRVSIARRKAIGGTAPEAVIQQVRDAKQVLEQQ
ncbi:MAG: argininosuccinate lyase, partial [Anaerolineales bacterium]